MDGWWTQRDVQENWLNCSFNADLDKEPEVFVWSGVRIVTLTTTAASLHSCTHFMHLSLCVTM